MHSQDGRRRKGQELFSVFLSRQSLEEGLFSGSLVIDACGSTERWLVGE